MPTIIDERPAKAHEDDGRSMKKTMVSDFHRAKEE